MAGKAQRPSLVLVTGELVWQATAAVAVLPSGSRVWVRAIQDSYAYGIGTVTKGYEATFAAAVASAERLSKEGQ